MSNGVAYVLDEAGTFESRINRDMVEPDRLDAEDIELLRLLVREHEEKTASPRARTILVQWDDYLPLFRKVAPRNGAALVAATRAGYLASSVEAEVELVRRSA
jgi:glutamate synthase domain-containing protein 3